MSNDTKVCRKCKIEQPISAFGKCKSTSDGLWIYCKSCEHNRSVAKSEKRRRENKDHYVFNENGKRCPGCGERKPLSEFHKNRAREHGIDPYCKVCTSKRRSQDRRDNPERYFERGQRYYYLGNGKANNQRWRENNREKARQSAKNTYSRYHARYLEIHRQYHALHKDKHKARMNKRRALEHNAGTFTASELQEVIKAHTDSEGNLRCALCGKVIRDNDYHVDHWIPLSQGGSNTSGNLRIMHSKCNLSKHNKLPPQLGRLI